MVGQHFVQFIIRGTTLKAKPISHHLHRLPLGSQALAEKDKLELEKDDRIDARTTSTGVERAHQFPPEGEIERLLQAAVEVVFRDEFFKGEVGQRGKGARILVPIT